MSLNISDAYVFRLFAKEAMHDTIEAVSQDERRALEELACTWAQAAMMSEREFGSSFTSSLRPLDEAISRGPLLIEGVLKKAAN